MREKDRALSKFAGYEQRMLNKFITLVKCPGRVIAFRHFFSGLRSLCVIEIIKLSGQVNCPGFIELHVARCSGCDLKAAISPH